jgi:hypothetical protein
MKREELIEYLNERAQRYNYKEETDGTITINDTLLETFTQVTKEAIEKYTLDTIIMATHQGKNIEHITRVTGYFSKVGGWNKGKRQELIDRHRTPLS